MTQTPEISGQVLLAYKSRALSISNYAATATSHWNELATAHNAFYCLSPLTVMTRISLNLITVSENWIRDLSTYTQIWHINSADDEEGCIYW